VPTAPTLMVVLAAFVAMEPMTYLLHRYVMHGPGLGWHRSHHARHDGGLERNDWYPVVFATTTITAMLIGAVVPRLSLLLPIGAGVTMYGMAYLFVHDVYIHRRLARRLGRTPALDRLADAHGLHHRFGGEPYGMLFPVIPARLRARVAVKGRDAPDQPCPSADVATRSAWALGGGDEGH